MLLITLNIPEKATPSMLRHSSGSVRTCLDWWKCCWSSSWQISELIDTWSRRIWSLEWWIRKQWQSLLMMRSCARCLEDWYKPEWACVSDWCWLSLGWCSRGRGPGRWLLSMWRRGWGRGTRTVLISFLYHWPGLFQDTWWGWTWIIRRVSGI